MNISQLAIRYRTATLIFFILLFFMGYKAYESLMVDLFPKVDQPFITVTTIYPGTAPEEMESLISRKIEDSLAGLNGVEELTSTSSDGLSIVNITFKLEVPVDSALADVRDRVANAKRNLPQDAQDPVIQRFDPASAPIVIYKLSGKSAPELTDYVNDVIKPDLEKIPGVAQVNPVGGLDREIKVYLDPDKLMAHNITIAQVISAIGADNINFPGGHYEKEKLELSVRVEGKSKTVEEMQNLLVPTPYMGASFRIKNLGRVESGFKEQRIQALSDREPAVAFSVVRQTDANLVDVASKVKRELRAMTPQLQRDGIKLEVRNDQSNFIKMAKTATEDSILIGALLATLVIFIFIKDWRGTLIAAIAIPLSIYGTYILMAQQGFTLNMLTLLALAMVVGILVDDAIVALENIVRHMEMGKTPMQAAMDAPKEILMAMTATTFTIVAVFGSIAFMQGMTGRFFNSFGLTVTSAVLISLLVAATLTPLLASRLLRAAKPGHSEQQSGKLFMAIREGYGQLLTTILSKEKYKLATLGIALATLIISLVGLLPFIPKGFMTPIDRGEINIALELDPGANLMATQEKALEVDELLRKHKEVQSVFITVGSRSDNMVNKANMGVTLIDKKPGLASLAFEKTIGFIRSAGGLIKNPESASEEPQTGKKEFRTLSAEEFKRVIRPELAVVKDVKIAVQDPGGSSPRGPSSNLPYAIDISGKDLDTLKKLSEEVEKAVATIPGIVDIDSTYGKGKPEVLVIVDRAKAAEVGSSTMQIAQALNAANTGFTLVGVSFYDSARDKDLDITVQLSPEKLKGFESLKDLPIPNKNNTYVPLSAVAHIENVMGPTQIDRKNKERRVMVFGNTQDIPLGTAIAKTKEKLAKIEFPPGYSYEFLGQAKQMRDMMAAMSAALLLAVILIYAVLAIQYNSFVHPITVMISLPLSLIGAFLGLFVFHSLMGLMAMIGMVMLMGLVNKNAILLVDFALRLKREGVPTNEALVQAGKIRLRPILMTTFAMVCGMIPIAMGLGAASEFRSPMGAVVVGGLITSTLLTLIVVPVVFAYMDRIRTLPGMAKHLFSRILKGDQPRS